MIFSSNIFLFLFFPIILICYFLVHKLSRGTTPSNLTLIILSLLFYLWGNGSWYLLIFLLSILVNYFFGHLLNLHQNKKLTLGIGIGINVALLAYFKLLLLLSPHSILPIGVSFYTFMAISFLIDTYRVNVHSISPLKFATYLSLFPHIVAGPIVRYNEIEKEIEKRIINTGGIFNGFVRFSYGLGKKVIIANNLAFVVDKIYAIPISELSFGLAWIGVLAFAFQIYYDFSGYSDMAIGLAHIFGFHFPENFDNPYRARSVTEFWRKWHISLSSWLRDYVYIPLGGSRKGNFRTYLHIFIVFLLCGMWHGLAFTFILWGMYQAIIIVIERYLKNRYHFSAQNRLFIIPTFILVASGWVLFRSTSLDFAFSYIRILFSLNNPLFISRYYHLRYYLPTNSQFILILAFYLSFFTQPKIHNKFIIGISAIGVLLYSASGYEPSQLYHRVN